MAASSPVPWVVLAVLVISAVGGIFPNHAPVSLSPALTLPTKTTPIPVADSSASRAVAGRLTASRLSPTGGPAKLGSAVGSPTDPSSPVQDTLVVVNGTVIPGNFNSISSNVTLSQVVYDPADGLTYVSDPNGGAVIVVSNGHELAGIPLFGGVSALTYDAASEEVFAASNPASKVAIINGTTVEAELNVSNSYGGPLELGYDPINELVYAVCDYEIFLLNATAVTGNFSISITPFSGFASFDPEDSEEYIDDVSSIVVVSGEQLIARIATSVFPYGLAYDPIDRAIYATQFDGNDSFVEGNLTFSGNRVAEIVGTSVVASAVLPNCAGGEGSGDAYDPVTRLVYVACDAAGDASVIGLNGTQVDSSQPVSGFMLGMSYIPNEQGVYVADDGGGYAHLLLIQGAAPVENAWLEVDLRGVAYDSDTNRTYVSDAANDTVAVLSGATIESWIVVPGGQPGALLYDPTSGLLYATEAESNEVAVLNQFGVVANLPLSGSPSSLALGGQNGWVYVSEPGSGELTALNGTTVVGSVTLGGTPGGMAWDSLTDRLYVANEAEYTVSVLSNLTLVENVSVPAAPSGVVFDPADGYVYVSEPNGGLVQAILGALALGSINVSGNLTGLTFNPLVGDVYALTNSGEVDVLNGRAVSNTFNVGREPLAGSFDPETGVFYVINEGSGTVSLVAPAPGGSYPVEFTETGLPSGDQWTVYLDGLTTVGGGVTVDLSLVNGTYGYTIPWVGTAPAGYAPTAFFGSVTVNGSAVTVNVVFVAVPLFSVSVTEAGLPAGTQWWLNTSMEQLVTGSTHTLTFTEPAGTFNFSGQGPSRSWYTIDSSITVTGSGSYANVTFHLFETSVAFSVDPGSFDAPLTLPNGTTIFLNLSNGHSLEGRLNTSSFVPVLNASLLNGTYSYQVSVANRTWMAFAVSLADSSPYLLESGYLPTIPVYTPGAEVTVQFFLIPLMTGVEFVPSGLAQGTMWNLTLSGEAGGLPYSAMDSGTGTAFNLQVNGTYNLVATVPAGGYLPVRGSYAFATAINVTISTFPDGGVGWNYTVRVLSIPVAFTRTAYPVSWAELGLPAGTSWGVVIGNRSYSASAPGALDLSLPNGTYVYSVGNSPGYYPVSSSGEFLVNGTGRNETVSFLPYAHLYGYIGLANGSVGLNGSPVPLYGGYFNLTLRAGTYSVVFSGQGSTYRYVVTLVPGESLFLRYPPAPLSSSGPWFVVSLIAIAAAAGLSVALGVALWRKRGPTDRAIER